MYGLPSDFDPQIFVGRELESITYAVNVIVLSFSDQLIVSVAGAVPYRIGKDAEPSSDRPPAGRTKLVSLVGRSVQTFDLKSPRELVLGLGGEACVTLLDDADNYECYQISTREREIIV